MPLGSVRFRVTNIDEEVTCLELQEALTSQLALDNVQLDAGSLSRTGDGKQEAEMELSHEEAAFVRGPMREAKVFIGRTMVLHFEELTKDRGRSRPTVSGAPGNPFATHSTQHLRRTSTVSATSPEPEPRISSWDLDPRTDSKPSRSTRPKQASNQEQGLFLGRRSIEERQRRIDALRADEAERTHTLQPVPVSSDRLADRSAQHSITSRNSSRGEQEPRPSVGPELAYCSRFLPEGLGGLPGEEPKLMRACTNNCVLQ